jgi:NosR/NirI family nitrous oxide reductase transcriptional regulator
MSAPKPNPLARYTRWLHTRWPAGAVERAPAVNDDGSTNVPGLYVAGDLTGVPLLKLSADTGARAVRTMLADPAFRGRVRDAGGGTVHDLVIVGAGVSGMAAALEARKHGLDFVVLEASEPFTTIVNFPKAKPIFTYPTGMVPAGDLRLTASVKEALVEELRRQTTDAGIAPRAATVEAVRRKGAALEVATAGSGVLRAHRVLVAIGRSGNFSRLGVPGEDRDKVYNRLHDPKDFAGKDVLVVGGGDSALETAAAVASAGGRVTLSYRNREFSRPKSENVNRVEAAAVGGASGGTLRLALGTTVRSIGSEDVRLTNGEGKDETIPNDAVFAMIGREAPLDFFRRSGVAIRGEWTAKTWAGLVAFLGFCVFLYNWKAGGALTNEFQARHWFPFEVPAGLGALGKAFRRPSHLLGTLALSLGSPGFYYSLAYCLCVVGFGARRIARRKTPYVKVQTLTLMAVQVVPLFLLPYVVLPWMGHNGWFDAGAGKWIGDQLFPLTSWDPQGREYWRAFGIVLAWPLFVWNVFSAKPMALWLAISLVQTFGVIPLIVYRWGKGAYCGWICSCGALAETLGDAHRRKMPHGPVWNRLNMTGQLVLAAALVLAALRVVSWIAPGSLAATIFDGMLNGWHPFGIQTNYFWIVDVGLAGILGVGLYFHYSGRVWCRFACPLAALMHVYARFSSFRILAEKSKCISCNVCTSVCHQGIDVMSFANKGAPMEDPQCVRCSACVASCPTGVLTFGRVDRKGTLISIDTLLASPVQRAEGGPKAAIDSPIVS